MYKIIVINAPPTGVVNQQINTLLRPARCSWLLIISMPIIAPTTAWDVDTGNPKKVITLMVSAAAIEDITAWKRSKEVKPFKVSIPAWPDISAPKITKMDASKAAVQNLIILDETAVPKIFDASLAPRDYPKNIPPKREYIKPSFSCSKY